MDRNKRVIACVTGIIIILLILLGIAYAYFLTRITGNTSEKSVNISTGRLSLTYGDGNGIIEPITKLSPGTTIATKTFTVTNDGTDQVSYDVIIEDIIIKDLATGNSTTFERTEDFIYTLTCVDNLNNSCNGRENAIYPMTNNTVLVNNSINVGITQNYELTLTYKEASIDQGNDMNKTFTSKINIKNPS